MPVKDINDSLDRVLMMSCGSNFSICYTELGILYSWGLLMPDKLSSIQWYPRFLSVSIPQEDYELDESFLYEFHLTDI